MLNTPYENRTYLIFLSIMNRKSILFTHEKQAAKLSYLDNERENKPILMFCHANGYSAETYSYYHQKLDKKYRVIGIDFLNHGQSETNLNFSGWYFYRDQICSLIDELKLSNVIGIGHSMGAAALIQAGYKKPELFSYLIGFDPTILNFYKIACSRIFLNPAGQGRSKEKKFV